MKVHLLVFASDDRYIEASNRLISQAEGLNIFDNVIFIEPDKYPNYFIDFINSNIEFFENNPRGYGYWLWKPFLVNWQLLNVLEENDVLIYLDSGCEISSFGKKDLLHYINLTVQNDGLFFNTKFKERSWTKMDLINYFNSKDLLNTKQIQATFFLIKNTKMTKDFTSNWLRVSMLDNYHYIDDSISESKNLKYFKEHRHDQSVLSILVKKNRFFIIDCDYLFFSKLYFFNSYVLKYPIHAIRNIGGESRLNHLVAGSDEQKINSLLSRIKFIFFSSWYEKKHKIYNIYIKLSERWML